MARAKTIYVCGECGARAPQWTGWCPACDASGSMDARPAPSSNGEDGSRLGVAGPVDAAAPDRAVPITEAMTGQLAPVPTGVPEVDRVLGGGLVPGSVTLVGGEPGIGKSTLLMQVASAMAAGGRRCGYVSAEESAQQVASRAQRLGVTSPDLYLAAEPLLPRALDMLDRIEPEVVLVDSIQALVDPSSGARSPASLAQVRGCAQLLVEEAKRRRLTVVMVGHVTKDGGLAGPKVLEHVVDSVLSFEGERHHALRLLRATKHRFGGTHELGLFEMGQGGLTGVPDPSALFLADRHLGISGSVVAPVLDGQRPLLVEVQALVAPTQAPMPRRTVQGFESARLAQVLAVLERRAGVVVSRSDVHVAVAGGVRVREPGIDLAVALAVASAQSDCPLLTDLVACGEVGLGGEVRQVQRTDRRLAEAARLGFGLALAPRSAPDPPEGLTLSRVPSLAVALASAGLRTRSVTTS